MKASEFAKLCEYVGADNSLKDQLKETLEIGGNDMYFEGEDGEFRLIHDDVVERIWEEELQEVIEGCFNFEDIPIFVAIDWQLTVNNCKVDGMGHHFSSYDGSEENFGPWNVFRTN